MQKVLNMIGLALVVAFLCYGASFQATSHPLSTSDNVVRYQRFKTRYPLPGNLELYVYEVRNIYYVNRTMSNPTAVKRLSDDEMDLRIQCDFQQTDSKCTKLVDTTKTMVNNSSVIKPTATTVSPVTTGLPLLPELPQEPELTDTTKNLVNNSSVIKPTATTVSPVTTGLPFLPELPQEPEAVLNSTSGPSVKDSVPNYDDEDYLIDSDDDTDDLVSFDSTGDVTDYEHNELFTPGSSIGGNDMT